MPFRFPLVMQITASSSCNPRDRLSFDSMADISMASLKTMLAPALDKLPASILCKVLARKLREASAPATADQVAALAQAILRDEPAHLSWEDPTSTEERVVKLVFDEEDEEEIERLYIEALASLPKVLEDSLLASGDQLFKKLVARWPAEYALQLEETGNFCAGVEERWGKGLRYLRMLLTSARELGAETSKRHSKSKSMRRRYRRWVMQQLHIRSCQVMDEIICLLENGFADGAMARWRTLFEITVVAVLISDGDEDLAERYIAHDAVEAKREMDNYEANLVPLGFEPQSRARKRAVDGDHQGALNQFGPAFAHPYGWAAKHLNTRKPTFKDLQVAAGHVISSCDYKTASFNVHAGARSLFFTLGTVGDASHLVAGRSNAGLGYPGSLAAQSLFHITTLYAMSLESRINPLRIVVLNGLLRMRDEANTALSKASKKLHRDEATIQRNRAKAAKRRPIPAGSTPKNCKVL